MVHHEEAPLLDAGAIPTSQHPEDDFLFRYGLDEATIPALKEIQVPWLPHVCLWCADVAVLCVCVCSKLLLFPVQYTEQFYQNLLRSDHHTILAYAPDGELVGVVHIHQPR